MAGEFKDAEHPKEAHDAEGHEVVGVGENEVEPGGKDGGEIDKAEEAGGVAPRAAGDGEAGEVLDGEDGGEEPLEGDELGAILGAVGVDALDGDGEDIGGDEPEQDAIEAAAGGGVGEEDDAPDLFASRGHGVHLNVTKCVVMKR